MDTEALDGLWAIADALGDLRCDSGWFGGLDLSRDCEDPRAPFSGDKFSAVREVAKTDGGFSSLEVQRCATTDEPQTTLDHTASAAALQRH